MLKRFSPYMEGVNRWVFARGRKPFLAAVTLLFSFSLAACAPSDGGSGDDSVSWKTADYLVAQVPEDPMDVDLCGNGIVDSGESCDPADPTTALGCSIECDAPSYLDYFECMDARHEAECVDENNESGDDYYDCVDAQNVYCISLGL